MSFLSSLSSLAGGAGSVVGSLFGDNSKKTTATNGLPTMGQQESGNQNIMQQQLLQLLGMQQSYGPNISAVQGQLDSERTKIKAQIADKDRQIAKMGGNPKGAEQVRKQMSDLQAQLQLSDEDFANAKGIKIPYGQVNQAIPGYEDPDKKAMNDYQSQMDPLAKQFNDLLNQTASKDFQLQGLNPQEANAAAQQFVDQTYTNRAKQQLQDFQNDLTSQLSAKSAALGRDPNLDSATNSQIYQQTARGLNDINLNRGQQVAQRADMLSYQRPLDQLNILRGGMGQVQQNSGFLNDLATRAQSNRLNLLNGLQSLNSNYFKERSANSTATQANAADNLGLIGNISKGITGAQAFGQQLSSPFSSMSGMSPSQGLGSLGNAGEYTGSGYNPSNISLGK